MQHHQRPDRSSTYFVQDRSNQEELTRLTIQDQLLTTAMGGVLPEQPQTDSFKRVLDVACGTGGWLINAAKTYPAIERLIGVDISKTMLNYARKQAEAEGVADRVSYETMDALLILEFPNGFFDLTNQRLGLSYLRKWDWPKLLSELQRTTRPDGVVRLTEADIAESNSPALNRLNEIMQAALFRAGNFFAEERNGITGHLPELMQRYSFLNIQTRVHELTFHGDTPEGAYFAQDMEHAFHTGLPFLRKWGPVPRDYDTIYQQALVEMRQPDFVAQWPIVTTWGINPG